MWRLATNVDYRTISALFGIGCSTVGAIVIETCEMISKHLFHKYICVPSGERLQESRWGFPQVVAAIDGSHIPINKPYSCPSDYYNRKGFYSIIVQGLEELKELYYRIGAGNLAMSMFLYSFWVMQHIHYFHVSCNLILKLLQLHKTQSITITGTVVPEW